MLNSRLPTSDYYQKKPCQPTSTKTPELPPAQSTGTPPEKSVPLKIKVNADHAGLSPPPDLLNPLMEFSELPSEISLNNNWSIAHHHTEIWDAMEV
jgi:hypothetical protein